METFRYFIEYAFLSFSSHLNSHDLLTLWHPTGLTLFLTVKCFLLSVSPNLGELSPSQMSEKNKNLDTVIAVIKQYGFLFFHEIFITRLIAYIPIKFPNHIIDFIVSMYFLSIVESSF